MRSFNLVLAAIAVLIVSGCATRSPLETENGVRVAGVSSPSTSTRTASTIDAQEDNKERKEREKEERERGAMMAEYLLQMEADELGPPRAEQILRAVRQREDLVRATQFAKAAGVTSASWQALGPGNIGGRVRTIAIDPRNTSRIFIGAASGGIWLTEDAGQSWRPINDFLGSLSVSSLVFDPGNLSIMYAGTGEGSAGLVGVGVFKSTDNGLTWSYLANTSPDTNMDWRFVNRIAVQPQQGNVLLAGTTNGNNSRLGGIYRSADGGQSWVHVAAFKALDIEFDPNNPQNVVAGRDDGFIAYSRDAGQSWTATAQLIPAPAGRNNTARAEIAFARSRPGLIYASIDNNKGEVWKSDDAGQNWVLLSNPQHLNDQGDYDNALWVDPGNENNILTAGLDIYQSSNAGATFTKVSDWHLAPYSPHADHHAIVSVPGFGTANPTVYFGNDGGVYQASNVFGVNSLLSNNGWTNLNNRLAVTQFYAGAGKVAAGGRIIGGTQDNGSLLYGAGTDWRAYRGGDGGFVAVDPASDNNLYGEYVYLALHRSQNGGLSSGYICNGISEGLTDEGSQHYCGTNATKKANFIAPFILDPNNASRMLAGANSLWVSNNVKDIAPLWARIKDPLGGDSGANYINAVSVAEGNSDIIWVGHNGGQVFKTGNGTAPAPVWQSMLGLPARQVQRILIDRNNFNHVTVAFTGFVANNLWETRDGGASWASITGNLPQAPIFTVVRHANNANWLYVGTSVGIFTTENGGATWSASNDGPANVRVRELFFYSSNTLVAATYGRGMYKATIAGGGPDNYQGAWWAGASESGWGLALMQHGGTLVTGWYFYDGLGQPTWLIMPGCAWTTLPTFPAQFVCTGTLYHSTGAWLGSYSAANFAQNPVGAITFTFTDGLPSNGTMAYTVNGVAGTKSISKLYFGSGTPPSSTNYSDVWWGGPAQTGWGVALLQEEAVLAGSWYTYNSQGQPVWYLINSGTWTSATSYTAPLTRSTGSPLIGVIYNPALFASTNAGSVTFTFSDANNATMTYAVDGVTQTKSITRFQY
jgi:photosystem II stability/assembly factor-like uncharacterized protein